MGEPVFRPAHLLPELSNILKAWLEAAPLLEITVERALLPPGFSPHGTTPAGNHGGSMQRGECPSRLANCTQTSGRGEARQVNPIFFVTPVGTSLGDGPSISAHADSLCRKVAAVLAELEAHAAKRRLFFRHFRENRLGGTGTLGAIEGVSKPRDCFDGSKCLSGRRKRAMNALHAAFEICEAAV